MSEIQNADLLAAVRVIYPLDQGDPIQAILYNILNFLFVLTFAQYIEWSFWNYLMKKDSLSYIFMICFYNKSIHAVFYI